MGNKSTYNSKLNFSDINKYNINFILNNTNYKLKDLFRLKVYSYLKIHNLKGCTSEEISFFEYLNSINRLDLFEKFIKICYSDENYTFYFNELVNIINLYKNRNNIISFRKLYKLDKDWYNYYKLSASLDGKLINGETRRGVDKRYIKDIMILKKLTNTNLDDAIFFYYKLKNKIEILPMENPFIKKNYI